MHEVPLSVRPSSLKRLSRRLRLGLFLDVWPQWAIAGLLAAGLVAIVCRMFVAGAASRLPWLWLTPLVTTVPAIIISMMRTYRPAEIVALGDWLGGGRGLLLTMAETGDEAWAGSPLVEHASTFTLPRVRPWRKLRPLIPAAAFLGAALWLPQRLPAGSSVALADEIARDLTATAVELKQQNLISPEEEKKLQEEIERIRRGAEERVDPSSWEAADTLREKMAADLTGKQDAAKWAEESLARYAAAARGGTSADGQADAQAAELMKALEKLAASGLLTSAPPELQRLLAGGKLPADAAAMGKLAAALGRHLGDLKGRLGGAGRVGAGELGGRFNPAEFPLASQLNPDGDGNPSNGGVNRGRADAPLTWGKESLPFDRFKPQALPPGAARPDDWTPVVELPGAPQESPEPSAAAAARQYGAAAGQSAWRRTLAPRHQSAVKKYFAK